MTKQTRTKTEKERALALLHSAIEHNILISQDDCVAVIFSNENGEENWGVGFQSKMQPKTL